MKGFPPNFRLYIYSQTHLGKLIIGRNLLASIDFTCIKSQKVLKQNAQRSQKCMYVVYDPER